MESGGKRIAKNTLYLYARMLVMMLLGFFTTRIVLEKLGASDYGVYNVVGGFVSLFMVLNSILQSGTNRFLALALGRGDKVYTKLTFSTALVIHILIAVIVFILLETFGLWFLNQHLNISPDRLSTANWVFQFSVLSCMLGITQTPYSASITANEHFKIFAYLSILDVILKILILYLLVVIPGDKLIVYSCLLFLCSLLNITMTRIYCIRNFEESHFSLRIDKSLFKQMFVYSGWTMSGHLSAVLNSHGVNILLNIFFGTLINAARGLAVTVTFTIKQFVGGFTVASVPQLVKSYGSGDKESFVKIIFNISQVTLFLLAVFLIPVLLEIDFVLMLWLNDVPQYTASFIRITLVLSFLSYSNYMIDQGINAIGRVKEMNLWVTPVYLLDLPLSYLALKLGGSPVAVYWVSSIPMILAVVLNLFILNRFYSFPIRKYMVQIIFKNLVLVCVAALTPYILQQFMPIGFKRFFVVCSLSVCVTFLIFWLFALSKDNREMVKLKLLDKFKQKNDA